MDDRELTTLPHGERLLAMARRDEDATLTAVAASARMASAWLNGNASADAAAMEASVGARYGTELRALREGAE